MISTEYQELVARIQTCIGAGALEQAAILLQRVHSAGRQLPPQMYAKLPLELAFP